MKTGKKGNILYVLGVGYADEFRIFHAIKKKKKKQVSPTDRTSQSYRPTSHSFTCMIYPTARVRSSSVAWKHQLVWTAPMTLYIKLAVWMTVWLICRDLKAAAIMRQARWWRAGPSQFRLEQPRFIWPPPLHFTIYGFFPNQALRNVFNRG